MSKFTDAPYFILKELVEQSDVRTRLLPGEESHAYLHGPRRTIWARGGYGFDVFLKTVNKFYRLRLTKIEGTPTDNNFQFVLELNNYRPSELTLLQLADHIGGEIYFRKDGLLADYVKSKPEYRNFLNTNKIYAFFGNYYQSAVGPNIIFNGMKDFVITALPEVNRTERMKEFLTVYFDKIHNEPYSLLKNVHTLSDPFEVDENYLEYIANMYRMSVPGILPVQRRREYVAELTDLLKRKGTYTAILAIWRALTPQNSNYINIYERWHPCFLPEDNPSAFFEDHLFTTFPDYHTLPPTGGAGIGYYWSTETTGASGYPIYDLSDQCLSTHYRVEIDLTNQPLGFDYIIDRATISILLEQWELFRPVCRFSHYNLLVAPITDWTGNYKDMYSPVETAHLNTTFTSTLFEALSGGAVFYTKASKTVWDIEHKLSSKYGVINLTQLMIQCYDLDLKMIEPIKVYDLQYDWIRVEFNDAQAGYAFITVVDFVYNQTILIPPSSSFWVINHTIPGDAQTRRFVLSQIHDETKVRGLLPMITTALSANILTAEFFAPFLNYAVYNQFLYNQNEYNAHQGTDVASGFGAIASAHYISGIFPLSTTWIVPHNLGANAVMVQCYDEPNRELVYPKNITILDSNNVLVEFYTSTTGRVVVRAVGGSDKTPESVVESLRYFKIGTGGGRDWDYVKYNEIESQVGDTYAITSSGSDDNYYYINTKIREVLTSIGDTLVTNGDFDTVPVSADWTPVNCVVNSVPGGQDGGPCLEMTPIISAGQYVSQELTCAIGKIYRLELWVRGIDGDNYEILLGSVPGSGSFYSWSGTVTSEWHKRVEFFTATATSIYLTLMRNTITLNRIFFDTVSVYETEIGPAPITEIGLFDVNDDLVFYTYNSELYKPATTGLNLHYRIFKTIFS